MLDPTEQGELEKIKHMLNAGEEVVVIAKQSRFKPGGSITTPSTIFVTNKRLLIRNPTALGLRENVDDITYDKISSVKLEKGMFSSCISLTAPGLSDMSRGFGVIRWGHGGRGEIDAIPKDKAEQIVNAIKKGVDLLKKESQQPTVVQNFSLADELSKLAKLKEQGAITEEEFSQMKKDLLEKK